MSGSRTTALLAATATALALLAAAPPAQALVRTLEPIDGGGTGDRFGTSIALDGDTLVVGAPGQASARGAAYVFTRSAGETWSPSAKLTASSGASGDGFGTSVALDGATIVVGAPGDDGGRGTVFLFDRTGAAARTERATLAATDGAANDALGQAVAVDGATVAAGAPGDDLGVTPDANHGSVYTFSSGASGTASQTGKLTASDNVNEGYSFAGSALGSSVAIDGDVIVAGAPLDNFGQPTGTRRGSVYTFASTGAAARSQTGKLTVSGSAYGHLGTAVDVEGDLVVATDHEADGARGIAYTFARTGAAARTETGTLRPADPRQNAGYGDSVSLADSFVVVGAPDFSTGGAYVFTRTGAAGRPESWYTAGGAPGGTYGTSVATDGDRVVAGAPLVDVSSGSYLQDRGQAFSSTPDLTTTPVGAGSGTVAASPSGPYLLGDQVTLTATPEPGSHFAGWEDHAACTGIAPCVLTMTGDTQVAALFEPGAGDTTPPVVAITSGPAAGSTVGTRSVTFGLAADESATFACAYDGGGFAPCSTPGPATTGADTRTLAEGGHTFAVRATDSAGNASAAVTRSFTVDLPGPPGDTTRPQTRLTTVPAGTIRTTKGRVAVKVGFAASEPARFVCSLDGAAARACTSPATFRLAPGRHVVRITAIDRAGNRDASPAVVRVTIKRKRR